MSSQLLSSEQIANVRRASGDAVIIMVDRILHLAEMITDTHIVRMMDYEVDERIATLVRGGKRVAVCERT